MLFSENKLFQVNLHPGLMGMCLSKAGGVLGFILGTQSREVRTLLISGITSGPVTTGPVTLKDLVESCCCGQEDFSSEELKPACSSSQWNWEYGGLEANRDQSLCSCAPLKTPRDVSVLCHCLSTQRCWKKGSWACWCIQVIPALRRLKQ